jgi:cobalt-zinc-cadmium efflux system outer membrane protein
VHEAAANLIAAEHMRQSQQTSVRAELRRQFLAAQSAARLLALYQQAVVPQASLALESSIASYQVGKADFTALLASFSAVLNYETESYRKLADYNIAIARIESLTGSPATTDSAATGNANSSNSNIKGAN